MDILTEPGGIWECTFVGECTKACPKNVDPAGAIQQYKLASLGHWVKHLMMPRSPK